MTQAGVMTAIWMCTFGNAAANDLRNGYTIDKGKASGPYPPFRLADYPPTGNYLQLPLNFSDEFVPGKHLQDLCPAVLARWPTLSIARELSLLVSPQSEFLGSMSSASFVKASVARISGFAGFALSPPPTAPAAAASPDLSRSCLAFLFDAFPPPILSLDPAGWVPTVSYAVNFFRRPGVASDGLVPITFETTVCEKVRENDTEERKGETRGFVSVFMNHPLTLCKTTDFFSLSFWAIRFYAGGLGVSRDRLVSCFRPSLGDK